MIRGAKTFGLLTRRELIVGAGAMALLAGCKCGSAHTIATLARAWNEEAEKFLFSPHRLALELPESEQTPERDFPCYFHSPTIPIAPANWRLRVGGLVQHPMVLTLEQLRAMPATSMRVRHYCVDGWSAVASWRGVRLSSIANLVHPDQRVKYVEFRSFDAGYFSGWDLASALHPQTLLAYEMNGHSLGADHGAPLRLYSAIKLGYKNVKYLTEVNFLPRKVTGFWEDHGFEWFAGV
jgi:DMSO/TMAO reductase YedYZ molybdopterin-dependent catalytic subunit